MLTNILMQVSAYLATWLPGYLATWLPGYLATCLPWLPGYLSPLDANTGLALDGDRKGCLVWDTVLSSVRAATVQQCATAFSL